VDKRVECAAHTCGSFIWRLLMKLTSSFGKLLQTLTPILAVGVVGCAASSSQPIVAVDETRYLVQADFSSDAISRAKSHCAGQGNGFEALHIVPEIVRNDGATRGATVTFRCH